MEKLLLVPDADGYNSTDGTEVIGTKLDGGMGRYRRDKIGATKLVSVKWTMRPNEFQYWRAFYASVTLNGTLPFKCDLLSEDGSGPAEHVCNFVPGSVTMPAQQGYTYVQQAQLEVKPLARDAEQDAQVVLVYSYFGTNGEPAFDSLTRLVNDTAPSTIGA